MNRFDRVTAILIQLQTKRVVTAQEIADRFAVSLRTVYRDIRTLENAGIPIGSEAGVGYFLDKRYHLPPVMFSLPEAAALVVGEKCIKHLNQAAISREYSVALDKVKAVLKAPDKDYIARLNESVDVCLPRSVGEQDQGENWLPVCTRALTARQVLFMTYFTPTRGTATEREVEAIGLYHYSRHWHLIGWCRYRSEYRDFRLDRIQSLALQEERYSAQRRKSLDDYLQSMRNDSELVAVKVRFNPVVAAYLGEQKYYHGFVGEASDETGTVMTFLTPSLVYFGRWLLSFTSGVEVLSPASLQAVMVELSRDVARHWLPNEVSVIQEQTVQENIVQALTVKTG
ncbi:helix-turn-helix type 11 domain protein [Oleiphilus messinensis]|uniref:Helix-turn-helix type 11 domain protein n=1 Tax=Oleiphilus messinensis TaxID=141451 RepID=A0A1Y0I350_9GAMM|nr:YafY family protein [Oleiphilus messinensis]ARU54216.1 helix-turn-helix type 11 domain protein [Oleiphilus messinensis]